MIPLTFTACPLETDPENTDPKSITITGIPNGTFTGTVTITIVDPANMTIYGGTGTVSGGSVTIALADYAQTTPYTGNGPVYVQFGQTSPSLVVYLYTDSKTLAQLNITPTDYSGQPIVSSDDYSKLPTITLSSATTTIPWSKLVRGAAFGV